MREQDRQAKLFSDADFIARNQEQAQSTRPKLDIGITLSTGHCLVDCFYYIGAGNCYIHGDAIGCDECEDYRSINEEIPEDDD